MISETISLKIIKLTLNEFILYIWLPIFLILLTITIIFVIKYFNKRNELKNKIIMEKKIRDEIENKLIEDLNKILNEFQKNLNEKKFKDAIILSYNLVKDKISTIYNIKSEEFLTEREMQEIYAKIIPSIHISSLLNKMYIIYEKIRFGDKEPLEKDIEEYYNYLKELSSRLKHAIP